MEIVDLSNSTHGGRKSEKSFISIYKGTDTFHFSKKLSERFEDKSEVVIGFEDGDIYFSFLENAHPKGRPLNQKKKGNKVFGSKKAAGLIRDRFNKTRDESFRMYLDGAIKVSPNNDDFLNFYRFHVE